MTAAFGFSSFQFLITAAVWTVALSAIAFAGGAITGLILALMRLYGPWWLRATIALVIQLIQAMPLLVLLMLSYFGLSALGFNLPAFVAASVSLIIFASVFLAEIWRGCIQSIPHQQAVAADALALTALQKMRHVILPQALRISVPPTVGFLVQIIKNSSVTSLIGFVELTRAGQLVSNATFQPLQAYLLVALIYFCICYPLSHFAHMLDLGKVNLHA